MRSVFLVLARMHTTNFARDASTHGPTGPLGPSPVSSAADVAHGAGQRNRVVQVAALGREGDRSFWRPSALRFSESSQATFKALEKDARGGTNNGSQLRRKVSVPK